jgi:nicotinate-nucleotide adenylyltransferase
MLKAAFAGQEGIRVSDIEERLPKPTYTLNTLRALVPGFDTLFETTGERVPFVIGEDSQYDLSKWFGFPTLLKNTLFLVCPRPEKSAAASSSAQRSAPEGFVGWPVDVNDLALASREIREKVKQGASLAELKQWVPESVAEDIVRLGLYREPTQTT